jgi:hypothetical protein
LLKENGFNAQINMQSWMFLSSYETLRYWLLNNKHLPQWLTLVLGRLGKYPGKLFKQPHG